MATAESAADSALPANPVEPRIFVEDVIPALFADLELTPAERALELRLGIVLRGATGGEWTLHFIEGELGIEPSRRPDCDVTLVQTVEDWRAALWEGRPAFVADALRALLGAPTGGAIGGALPFDPTPQARDLDELKQLRGLLEIRVAQRELGAGPAAEGPLAEVAPGDWRLGLALGPGPLPVTPDATITVGAAEAEAIHQGRLHPLEALMTGELRLEGDLGLILQVQAIAMKASLQR